MFPPLLTLHANLNTPGEEEEEPREKSTDSDQLQRREEVSTGWDETEVLVLLYYQTKGSDRDVRKGHKGDIWHSFLKEVIGQKNKFVLIPLPAQTWLKLEY